jgi:hypothetical protein
MDGGMPGADSGAVGEGGPDASADGLVCSQGGSSGSFAGAIQITIDGTKVAGDVHEFPLLVSIDDNPDLAREAQVDGLDIIFEEAQGEPLSHELEEYNNGTGALVAWVMVPLLRGGQDETLCLRYGHESLRQPSERPSVWSVDYRLVLHMADVSLLEDGSHLIVDSSTCGNDFVGHGPGLDVSTRALFGQGLGLNSGFLQRQDILGPLSSITLSAWVNLQPLVPGQKGAEVINLGNSVGLRMDDIDQDGVVMFRFTEGAEYDVAASGDFIAGAGWRYVVGIYDVTQGIQRVYLDGAPAAELAVSSPTGGATDQVTRIGMHVQDYQIWYAWQGTIDEVRVADVARSAERIATEYNNYSSPSTFYSLIHIPGSP